MTAVAARLGGHNGEPVPETCAPAREHGSGDVAPSHSALWPIIGDKPAHIGGPPGEGEFTVTTCVGRAPKDLSDVVE